MKIHYQIVALTTSSLLALSVCIAADKPKPTVHVRVNIAHQGVPFAAPCNTLAAVREAVKAGCDGCECDVRRSADGVVILSHDRHPQHIMGGAEGSDKMFFDQMSYKQIRQFDAGGWKGEQFKGEKIPTLDEYLKLLKGTTCYPVIEIKGGWQTGIEADIIKCLRENDMVDVSTIIAFGANDIQEILRLEPKICVGWLYGYDPKERGGTAFEQEENAEWLADILIQRCREIGIAIVIPNDAWLSPKLVKLLNEADIHVWTYTVNNEAAMRRYLDWGVVGILTDKPDILAKILEERKKIPSGNL